MWSCEVSLLISSVVPACKRCDARLWLMFFNCDMGTVMNTQSLKVASLRISIDVKIAEPQLCYFWLLAAICRYAAEQQPWAPHISGILTNFVRCLPAGRARGGAEEGRKKSSIRRDIWWQQRFTIIQQTCPSLVSSPGWEQWSTGY